MWIKINQMEKKRLAGKEILNSKIMLDILSWVGTLDEWMILMRSLWQQTKKNWDDNEQEFIDQGVRFKRELKEPVFLSPEESKQIVNRRNYHIFDRIYYWPTQKILIKNLIPLIKNLGENYTLVLYTLANYYGYSYFKVYFRKETQIYELLPSIQWFRFVPDVKIIPFSNESKRNTYLNKYIQKGAVIIKCLSSQLHIWGTNSPVIWDYFPSDKYNPSKTITEWLSLFQKWRSIKCECKPTILTVNHFDIEEWNSTLSKSILTKFITNIFVQNFLQFNVQKLIEILEFWELNKELTIRFLEKAYFEAYSDRNWKIVLDPTSKIILASKKIYSVDIDLVHLQIFSDSINIDDVTKSKWIHLKVSNFLFSKIKSSKPPCRNLSMEMWIKRLRKDGENSNDIYLIVNTDHIQSINGKIVNYNRSTPMISLNNEVWFYNNFFDIYPEDKIIQVLSTFSQDTLIKIKNTSGFRNHLANMRIQNEISRFREVLVEGTQGIVSKENDIWKYTSTNETLYFQIPKKRKAPKEKLEEIKLKLPRLEDI